MEDGKEFLSIPNWAEEDRPREKLLLKGKGSLTDAELIAILLRTGVTGSSALDIAKKILHRVNGQLHDLGKLSVNDLKKMEKGLGETKAISLVAALELGRRRQGSEVRENPLITSSKDGFDYIYPELADLPHENFYVIYLNKANKVITHKLISTGGVSGTVADVKIILKHAIELLATAIIAVHNHPSGNLKPSQLDIDLTRKLRDAARLMEIHLFDHLITGERKYYSFTDSGLL
jgi:DNA repair protein RadC